MCAPTVSANAFSSFAETVKRLYPHQQGRRETHHRSRKQRPPDILKEAEGSGFKYGGLAFFRVKALDHAHTSKRFRLAPGDLGDDLSALTENRANRVDCVAKNEAEDEKKAERQNCQSRTHPDVQ